MFGGEAMRQSVQDRFRTFTEPLEGVVPYMYQDVKGLITIGIGNLIDPISLALPLPFRFKSGQGVKAGQFASGADITTEWNFIKRQPELARKGHLACAPITKLELNDNTINRLVIEKLQQNELFLKRRAPFRNFDDWPADAQLGLLSMAYAMGPGFQFPKFSEACQNLDFDTAAEECKMQEAGNPGVIPRNQANSQLFRNAAAVLAGESEGFYQRATLYYPTVLLKPVTREENGD
jgi:GH24 family phage-related lysozyme (muramidase)